MTGGKKPVVVRQSKPKGRWGAGVCVSVSSRDPAPESCMIAYICVSNAFHCPVVSLPLMCFLLLLGENIKGRNEHSFICR